MVIKKNNIQGFLFLFFKVVDKKLQKLKHNQAKLADNTVSQFAIWVLPLAGKQSVHARLASVTHFKIVTTLLAEQLNKGKTQSDESAATPEEAIVETCTQFPWSLSLSLCVSLGTHTHTYGESIILTAMFIVCNKRTHTITGSPT